MSRRPIKYQKAPYRIHYKDMDPEARRALDRRYSYYRAQGRGRLVPAEPVRARIYSLIYDHHMTAHHIGVLAGVDPCRIRAIKKGMGGWWPSPEVRQCPKCKAKPHDPCVTPKGVRSSVMHVARTQPPMGPKPLVNVRQSTYDAIMSVDPTPVHADRGPRVKPIGTQRRIQAMRADGFPVWLIAELAGMNRSQIYDLCTPGRASDEFVYESTARKVAEMYENYSLKTPADCGYDDKHSFNTVVAYARKRGLVPRHAWDSDTIDRPDAWPEWTGACGTAKGAGLHRKYHILPVCGPCNVARNARRQELGYPGREGRDGK